MQVFVLLIHILTVYNTVRDNCSQAQWKATVLSVSTPLNADSMFCTLTWLIWQTVKFYYKHAVAETSDEMGPPDFTWVHASCDH